MDLILTTLILIILGALTYLIIHFLDKKPSNELTDTVTVKVISKSAGFHTQTLKTMRPGMKSMTNDSSRSYPLSYGVTSGEGIEDNRVLPRTYPSIFKLIVEYDGALYDVEVSKLFFNETAVKQDAKMTIHKVYDVGSKKVRKIYFTE